MELGVLYYKAAWADLEVVMEAIIIILLVILIGLFLWYILQGRRRWKEQGDNLTKVVGEKVEGSMGVFGDLRERLGELIKGTKNIEEVGKSISSLQEALRVPQFRGGFGEQGLDRLLANNLPSGSYKLQYPLRNGEIRADAVIEIGGNLVPIDSKFPFPLEDFEQLSKAKSEDEQKTLRRGFIRTIKDHIDKVCKYIVTDEKTFDFALMYIPAENIYYETIVQSEIYSYCLQKRVFPVSPNSFYTYLKTIAIGFKGLQIEKFAQEMHGRLQGLQNDLQDFQEDYELIGRHISHAASKHTEAGNKLTKLSGRLELIAGETPIEKLAEGSTETHDEGS
jgi:DNA recombination protein RmuC